MYGLEVDIKSMFQVETEDASRLRELSGRSRPFKFSMISHGNTDGDLLAEFQSAFKVLGIDMENGWDAFEKSDFGYRFNSPVRNKSLHNSREAGHDYDRHCKTQAIEDELNDIGKEIIRYLKARLELIPNLYAWYRDPSANRDFQKTLLEEARNIIRHSRGLEIYIEDIILDDNYLTTQALAERDRKYLHIADLQEQKNKLSSEQFIKSVERKIQIDDALAQQKSAIMAEVNELESLQSMEEELDNPLNNMPVTPESIGHALSQAAQNSQTHSYQDAIKKLTNTRNETEIS